jgi:hypothetical protein
MAILLYDGREYPVPDDDVPTLLDATQRLASTQPGWLIFSHGEGEARLLIGPGTPVAIHTDTVVDLR